MIILVLYKGESGCDIYKQGIGQIDILWVNRLVIKFVLFNQLMIHLGEAANKVSWASVATPSSHVCVCVCVWGGSSSLKVPFMADLPALHILQGAFSLGFKGV